MAVLEGLNDLFKNPLPSLHPKDLLIGAGCGIALYFIVYFKAKNAKKFRHGMEYASASLPLKKTRYFGGSVVLSFFMAKSTRYFLATRSKDLILPPMSKIVNGITKDLKAIPKKLKAKTGNIDKKKFVLMNLPYILTGYFCDKVACLWRVSPGRSIFKQSRCL